jgi:hypothetical protein
MSPLAPITAHNPYVVHAMTGECVNNCDICGCSAERRANHTCCCQQKQKQKADHEAGLSDCCKKKDSRTAVIRCNCPCDPEKDLALLSFTQSEIIPFVFDMGLRPQLTDIEHRDQPRHMPIRFGEPPDPPPRLIIS